MCVGSADELWSFKLLQLIDPPKHDGDLIEASTGLSLPNLLKPSLKISCHPTGNFVCIGQGAVKSRALSVGSKHSDLSTWHQSQQCMGERLIILVISVGAKLTVSIWFDMLGVRNILEGFRMLARMSCPASPRHSHPVFFQHTALFSMTQKQICNQHLCMTMYWLRTIFLLLRGLDLSTTHLGLIPQA